MEALNEAVKKLLPEGLVPSLVTIAAILLATLILMKVINKLFKLLLKKGRVDATQVVFGKRILKGVVYILAICCVLFQFAPMQQFVVSLLAGSGILVVILGFAAQEAMANLVSGMFISIFKPFGLGDRIKLVEKNIDGVVEDITLRHTVVRTFENNRVVVPNSIANGAIIENVSLQESKVCNFLSIGIGYNADIQKAIGIIMEEALQHRLCFDSRTEEEKAQGVPPVVVRVMDLGEYAVQLRANIWSKNAAEGFEMTSDLRIRIKERFEREGIEIPYPYTNVIIDKSK